MELRQGVRSRCPVKGHRDFPDCVRRKLGGFDESRLHSRGRCRPSGADFRRRKGQSLLEFSLVALVLYLLFAGILTFGQLLYGAQSLQSAADTAAREIARLPLPPSTSPYSSSANGISLYDVLYNPGYSTVCRLAVCSGSNASVRSASIADDRTVPAGNDIIADWVKTWPIVNQMLYPLMIVNYVNTTATARVNRRSSCGIPARFLAPIATAGRRFESRW